jgi:hypothetical protein
MHVTDCEQIFSNANQITHAYDLTTIYKLCFVHKHQRFDNL